LRAAAVAAAVLALLSAPAAATVRIQKDAVALGFAAANCSYCHTFDSEHMMQQGADKGVRVQRLDCYACHRDRLPKDGPRLLNERGLFLSAAKRHLEAEKVDARWLKTYHEPEAKPKTKTPPRH
jgi:hypothetical protein